MVARVEEVFDGLDAPVVCDEPFGGETVVTPRCFRVPVALFVAEQLGKERVEPVLIRLAFDSGQEDAVRSDRPESVGAVGSFRDGITDLRVEYAEDRHCQEEVASLFALSIEDFLEEELGDRRVRHGEPMQQLIGIGTVADGQSRQSDPRHPPLGTGEERPCQLCCRLDRRRREQFPRLVEAEGEIALADLGHESLRTLAAERNWRIAPADENRVNGRRECGEERPEQSPVVRRQQMGIVEYDHRRRRLGFVCQ